MSDLVASTERNIRETAKMLARINSTPVAALTELPGVTRTGWYDRCNGKTRFGAAELAVLADFYKVPVQVFFEGPQTLIAVPLQPRDQLRRSTDQPNAATADRRRNNWPSCPPSRARKLYVGDERRRQTRREGRPFTCSDLRHAA